MALTLILFCDSWVTLWAHRPKPGACLRRWNACAWKEPVIRTLKESQEGLKGLLSTIELPPKTQSASNPPEQ